MKKNIKFNQAKLSHCHVIEKVNDRLILRCPEEGGGISFDCKDISWDDYKYLVFQVKNREEWMLGIEVKFWTLKEGNSEIGLSIDMRIFPDIDTTIGIPLSVLNSEKLYLDRIPGRFKTVVRGKRMDVNEISNISIGSIKTFKEHEFQLSSISLADKEPEYHLSDKKLIDEFGQLKIKEWPGKIHSLTELEDKLLSEDKEKNTSAKDSFFPHWSENGGWLEKKFNATGFFRTEYDGQRWWLVDPDGYAFFSSGLDCVRPGSPGRIDDLEKLFDWLPGENREFSYAIKERNDRPGRYFDFPVANLIRVFGEEWWNKWAEITKSRLYDWGINTVANWSDEEFVKKSNLPYVWQLDEFPTTEDKIFRDFPDVFSEEYLLSSKKYARQLEKFKNDRLMIGYFLRNEPHWAFIDDINIAEMLLESKGEFVSKEVFIDFLSERYNYNLKNFNKAWNLNLDSFKQLTQSIKRAADLSERAARDLEEFSEILIDRYVRTPSQELKKVDSNHLNLGIRYAYIADKSLLTGSDCFDVFSINCYKYNPAEMLEEIGEMVDMPVIIGEFHFGALDRGLISTGLRGVSSQQERGKAYRYYMENCALNKYCVGAHYFVLNDQAGLGRDDGENYQIGFIDVCHQPYQEMLSQVKQTNYSIYQIAAGKKEANLIPPAEIERV